MKFKPMILEELNTYELGGPPLKLGECTFEIKTATHAMSSKGNEMIKLELVLTDDVGGSDHIFDYLVASDAQACIWKIGRLCQALGYEDNYLNGDLPVHLLTQKKGRCIVKLQKGKPYINKEGIEAIGTDRNIIAEYLKPAGKLELKQKANAKKEEAAKSTEIDPELDDDIPF